MVECLEYLHVRDIVHCDVKSDNFAISATNPNKIVIFDFGLACAKDTNSQVFRGSLLYASIAAHRFEAVTPRHDLGSLGYLLCDFYSPLPWKSSQKSFPKEPICLLKYILELKESTKLVDLTKDFSELARYSFHVNENINPNYTKMKNILRLEPKKTFPFLGNIIINIPFFRFIANNHQKIVRSKNSTG